MPRRSLAGLLVLLARLAAAQDDPASRQVRFDDQVFDKARLTQRTPSRPLDLNHPEASEGYLAFDSRPWPGGVVPVGFGRGIDAAQMATFYRACQQWEAVANVHCVPVAGQPVRLPVR